MSVAALVNRRRALRLGGVASAQVVVQGIGFLSGILLIHFMEQTQYGYLTLAMSMVGMANVLMDLGLATAVMAIGGRLGNDGRALGQLVSDANAIRVRLSWAAVFLVVPFCVFMLMRQQAPVEVVGTLAILVFGLSLINVGNGVLLSVVRILGQVGFQQKLDLGANVVRLALLAAVASALLNAVVACLVSLFVAGAVHWMLRRSLRAHLVPALAGPRPHAPALWKHVSQQAPNSVYFLVSGQLTIWLIGFFGSAERVAEIGALGRLGAVFALLGSITATLVLPYFARRNELAEVRTGALAVNGLFACLFVVLAAWALLWPESMLWILGGKYAHLQRELVWMVASATLAAWSGTVYSIACSRGWVMPLSVGATAGIAATIGAALMVDVSTVIGCFQISTASGAAGVLVTVGYLIWRIGAESSPKRVAP
jgi:O-antigen/teichoic acid export membrane protein